MQLLGVDLRDLWRPNTGVTPRYVLWLAGQLPPDSAFRASVQGGAQFRAWTPTLHVLAGVANLLNAANRQRAGKKTREPLIRPPSSTAKPKARRISVAEVAARQKALEQAN